MESPVTDIQSSHDPYSSLSYCLWLLAGLGKKGGSLAFEVMAVFQCYLLKLRNTMVLHSCYLHGNLTIKPLPASTVLELSQQPFTKYL